MRPPPDESWREVFAIVKVMVDRGDKHVQISQALGVPRQHIRAWLIGEWKPGKVKCAEVMARVAAGAA